MEKRANYKETGLWIIKDHDGLYLCTKKPFKNYYGEHEDAFTWCCEGDFMKVDVSRYGLFSDMKYSSDPQRIEIVPEYVLKQDTVAE